MSKPIIEIYFDPKGIKNGRVGCYRARLKENHGIHSAGVYPSHALHDIYLTLKSFGMKYGVKDYEYEHN